MVVSVAEAAAAGFLLCIARLAPATPMDSMDCTDAPAMYTHATCSDFQERVSHPTQKPQPEVGTPGFI